jgi:hypothetical protein
VSRLFSTVHCRITPADLVRTTTRNTDHNSIDFCMLIPKSAVATDPTPLARRKLTIVFVPAKFFALNLVFAGPRTTLIPSTGLGIAGSRRAMKETRDAPMAATKMIFIPIAHCSRRWATARQGAFYIDFTQYTRLLCRLGHCSPFPLLRLFRAIQSGPKL